MALLLLLFVSSSAASEPRIHFLFLITDRIQRIDIWQRFFFAVPTERYRVLLHCKDIPKCSAQVKSSGWDMALKPPEVIKETMPTQYCTDLVSAENRLLEAALADRVETALLAKGRGFSSDTFGTNFTSQRKGSPLDKFVLLSDSSLPVKPFSTVFDILTEKPDTRFCVFPRQEWAHAPREVCEDRHQRCPEWRKKGECNKNPLYMHFQCQKSCEVCTDLAVLTEKYADSQVFVSPKVHEWKVLNRVDAERSVALWHKGYLRHLMQSLHLNWHDGYRNTGCLDEFWHFAALYGAFPQECLGKNDAHSRCSEWAQKGECENNPAYMRYHCQATCAGCQIPFWKFQGGSPFQFSLADHAGVQGKCDTFVKWSIQGAMGNSNAMTALDDKLRAPENKVRLEKTTGGYRPETILSVSTGAIMALRDSSFLFARKFKESFSVVDDCKPTVDSWSNMVFDQHYQKSDQEAWMGDGVWVDSNEHEVSITTDQKKPNTFMIQNGHEPVWSGWGVTCGERFSVVFQNRQSMTGYLDASDGNTLIFSNGVKWRRNIAWQGDGLWRDTHQNLVRINTFGGTKAQIIESNPEWNGVAHLDAAESDYFKAVFEKKIKGKNVQLWGQLSHDQQTIKWHNGQKWKRDKEFTPPCICESDHISWRLQVSRSKPKCVFIDIGAGSGTTGLWGLMGGHYNLNGHDPRTCDVHLIDANEQYTANLRSLADQYPTMVKALPATAMYSCETRGRVADFYGNSVHPVGYGGTRVEMFNFMRYLKEQTAVVDHVIVKMDIGGSEWDILPCLSRSSAARHIDQLYLRAYDPKLGSLGTSKDDVQPTLTRLRQFGLHINQI